MSHVYLVLQISMIGVLDYTFHEKKIHVQFSLESPEYLILSGCLTFICRINVLYTFLTIKGVSKFLDSKLVKDIF